ncbi:MAG: hypothetical protein SV201_03170 [Pseudomonadota bacterium]|nr:hypothetical protein [Pseudomonadota bacterium]
MQLWRQLQWQTLARALLLLVVLGQSALLLHESGHIAASGETECQLCLHAQPTFSVPPTIAVVAALFDAVAIDAPSFAQPVYFTPSYANASRAPPRY